MTLVCVIGVGLATLIAGPAVGAEGGSVDCDLVDAVSPAQVSCTVAGPAGSEFKLVLAATGAKGSEEVTSSAKRSSADSATFTQLVPEGATQIVATGVVNGAEVDSKVISVGHSAAGKPITLGLPAIAVASSAVAALILGAFMLFFGARTRAVERRGTGAYQGGVSS